VATAVGPAPINEGSISTAEDLVFAAPDGSHGNSPLAVYGATPEMFKLLGSWARPTSTRLPTPGSAWSTRSSSGGCSCVVSTASTATTYAEGVSRPLVAAFGGRMRERSGRRASSPPFTK
jgi:hypothetical protein